MNLASIINLNKHPISEKTYRSECKSTLDSHGALVLSNFLNKAAIDSIRMDGAKHQSLAYYTDRKHNIYLKDSDDHFDSSHPRNRLVTSSKGCITNEQIPKSSALHTLYNATEFKRFLCSVLGEQELYKYADSMSSVNLHYASAGQELGWHFDNSSFAITLMIHPPEAGGKFEYVKDLRNADKGEMNYSEAERVLNGDIEPETLAMPAGTLVLFRGRNSMHRVTPVIGEDTRMLAVLAYNTEPEIALSESARMTFYGRLN